MRKAKSNYLILLLLLVLFACPGIVAYVLYMHPSWMPLSSLNKGKLMTPPERLSSLAEGPKWRLILWQPKACESACLKQIDKLARIRLALGRRLYRVELLVVLADSLPLSPALKSTLEDKDIHWQYVSVENRSQQPALKDKPQVFLANPQAYLLLSYPLNAKPQDIFQDLGHLLKNEKKDA